MTKVQLQGIVDRFLAATPGIIVSARSHTLDRSSALCSAERGMQHAKSCKLWELVAARIDYHRLADSPARSSEAVPDQIQTMAMLEQGGDFAPATPELVFAPSMSASTEWWVA